MENELTVLSKVSHPNIMRVFELMEDDTNYYIVTEFIQGGNLKDKKMPLSEKSTRALIKQVLMALTYMHETVKISHRDIKLENVLCDGEVVKLTDFSFAAHFKPNEQFELPLGTPHYMSPEIVCQEEYDHRCDTWAVGILTYILLFGVPPFNSVKNDREELD